MSRYAIINTDVTIYLDEFSDDDLMDELEERGYKVYGPGSNKEEYKNIPVDLRMIAEQIKLNQDYLPLLKEYIYQQTGMII